MRLPKWAAVPVAALLAAILISGCGQSVYSDDTKIASSVEEYTYTTCSGGPDANGVQQQFTGFTGVDRLWTVSAAQDTTVKLEFSRQGKKGRWKFVAIQLDGQVFTLLEQKDGSIFSGDMSFNLKKGETNLCLVGDKADGTVILHFTDKAGLSFTASYG